MSKAFKAIERFSEDLDLILDWRVLGYSAEEPWAIRSNTKQDRFNQESNVRTVDFLKNEFIPALHKDLSGESEEDVNLSIDEEDGQTVLFGYPHGFSDKVILQQIRLEIGALAAWSPAKMEPITPYTAEQYGHLFVQPSTKVLTVFPERTFWEKITILHREANRPEHHSFPQRYSRHYYDIYCMAASPIKEKAFRDLDLLEKVVVFKEKFYRSPWAKYEDAKPASVKLMPPQYNIATLREDYEHMLDMIFDNKPEFDEIMEGIRQLEYEINQL